MSEKYYDFGLTQEQENRARKLHKDNIVIDMLFQGPIATADIPKEVDDQLTAMVKKACPNDIVRQVMMGMGIINDWSIDGPLKEIYRDCWEESGITAANRELDLASFRSLYSSTCKVQREFDSKEWLIKATRSCDIERAHKEGKKAGIVSCQYTVGFEKDLNLLKSAYDFGLRIVQLTYNNHNFVGAGCMEANNAGLSVFGIKFVQKLNELGIVVDTGHCGKQTTLDACKYSNKPVVASHTGAENVYFHTRCKSDEEIIAIAKTGGLVGIFSMPTFIAKDPKNTTLGDYLDHIDYVVNLVGDDHVGIGSDWPMSLTTWMAIAVKEILAPQMGFAPGDGPSTETVKGLEKYRYFINITRGLIARGYNDGSIKKIIGGNWLRVFKEVF